jgi:hypothetical protein
MNTPTIPLLTVVLAALLPGLTACTSTAKRGGGKLAWVNIEGHSRPEIQEAVEKVLEKNGFDLVTGGPQMVFDRQAGGVKTLAYSSLSGKGVYSRVKITIDNDGVGGHVVGLNAYVVRDRGDPIFEDEQKLLTFSKGEYQDMLDQVKQQLTP